MTGEYVSTTSFLGYFFSN